MTNLAVWRIDESGTLNSGQAPLLSAVERSHLGVLETHLESWIAAAAKLIGGGLTIVGRQVHIDDGILDLLAIDGRDRWHAYLTPRSRQTAIESLGARIYWTLRCGYQTAGNWGN